MTDNKDGAQAPSGPAEANRLRDAIDRGGTGDKVAFSDPAAAPLGTDDEAAGAPPTYRQARAAQRQEGNRAAGGGSKGTPADLNAGMNWWTGAAIAFAIVAILALAWLLMR